jgi:hypothetical protein
VDSAPTSIGEGDPGGCVAPDSLPELTDPDLEEKLSVIQQEADTTSPMGFLGLDCNHLSMCMEPDTCLKAQVPLSKLKGLVDELDVPAVIETRCEACSNCPTCKLSAREKTKSLQERFEQDVLKGSVHINFKEKKVEVDLPFIKDPVEYLSTKHNGPDNLYQAKRYYLAQCRKRPEVKEHLK